MTKEKKFNLILLLLCIIIYFIDYWIKKATDPESFLFIRFYLNDILAPIALLSFFGIRLNDKGRQSVTEIKYILLICALCSFVWECCGKLFNINSTFDYLDIGCYFCGGLVYWILANILRTDNNEV